MTGVAASLVLVVAAAAARPSPPPPPPSRLDKLGRVLALEDRRTLGNGDLVALLQDDDRGVRRRAALAAGRIGNAAIVPALIALMDDGEPEIRQMAAFALGLVGDAQATARLTAALGDPVAVVRARSAEALGRIGGPGVPAALARMVAAATPGGASADVLTIRGDDPGSPTDPWLELRLGLFALARLKDARAAESVLLRAGRPRYDWWAATWTAMRIESPGLKPVLVAAAASTDAVSRALAARGLGAIKDAGSVDLLSKMTRDADQTVAVNALRALGAIGDARGVAAAGAALRSPDTTLVGEGLRALAALPPDRSLRDRVVPLVGHAEAWVRAAALQALARMDRDDLALVLSGLDPDPDWMVRAGLAEGLGQAGDERGAALLFGMLKDEDARVYPAVLEALVKARGPDAADTLARYLQHPDFAVRAAAAKGLADLKATGKSAALAAAYRASLPDADLDARLEQVGALALQKDAAARETLLEAARSDPSRVVRERAIAALRSLGGAPAPAPGPDAIDRPAFDYREAMAPYDPRPDVPLFTPRAILHTRYGTIEIHLNVIEAPLTAASFMDLARRGFYDGLTFHRVVPGFVIQGGDPRGDGNGGPGYTLRCEIGERPYGRGTVGMALSGKDTGGSQFFITHSPTPHLDGGYTVFGWVAAGMDVVDKIRPGDVIERVEIWTGP
jgi:cyclophilin family peptidyl-prolyl cis-trans isomerase/HEAT repeat protein